MKNWIIATVALFLNASLAFAGEAPASASTCTACHGADGVSVNPQWPNLAGQNADYLAAQLTAFRDGERENLAMAPFVASLSDADIRELAIWYSVQPLTISANGDPKLVSAGENLSGYCMGCHGVNGVPAADEWPRLAGQNATYLHSQLSAFKSGKRVNSHMAAAIAPLGDAEFAALAAYYSQLKPQ
mgnify:CR=1 FL=1|tara:strand:+ start:144431 stop:144991 length:561 start_codon:yes stop_codon:yes gene_type:complete